MFEEMIKGRGSPKHIFGNLGVTQRFFLPKGFRTAKKVEENILSK